MDTPVGEKSKTQERIIQGEEVLSWLTYAGNDERKLLTLLALDEAEQPLSVSGLSNYIAGLSGMEKIPGNISLSFQYCRDSLVHIGAVKPTTTTAMMLGKIPKEVPAFEVTDSHPEREFAKAFSGALLSWSIEHPEMSLNILGQTASSSGARTPLRRFWALYDLATAGDSPRSPSIIHIAEHLNLPGSTRSIMIERLRQLGLVNSESSLRKNERQFRIVNPNYQDLPRKRSFSSLAPESRILLSTFQEAAKTKDVWGLDEFMALVEHIYPDAPPDVLRKARKRMGQVFAPAGQQYTGVVEAYGDRPYEEHSRVGLTPEASSAIKGLIEIIDAFYSGDPEVYEEGLKQSASIITEPEVVSTLYEKAFASSTRTNHDVQIELRLGQIVRNAGQALTSRAVRDIYDEQTGRKISSRSVQVGLGNLIARGEVKIEQSDSGSKRQPGRLYSAV